MTFDPNTILTAVNIALTVLVPVLVMYLKLIQRSKCCGCDCVFKRSTSSNKTEDEPDTPQSTAQSSLPPIVESNK